MLLKVSEFFKKVPREKGVRAPFTKGYLKADIKNMTFS